MTNPIGEPGNSAEEKQTRRPTGRLPGGRLPAGSLAGSKEVSQAKSEPSVKPVRVDIGKRLVALIIDFFACYLLAVVVSLLPFINQFLPLQSVLILAFLSRDFLFAGRGLGKNLMGLQVVDVMTAQPCKLLQSIQRNIVLVAPYVVLTIVDSTIRFLPIPLITDAVITIINLCGMAYCAIVLPLEAYRAYSRSDGLRLGDDIAGTALIEAPMDFSNFLPRE